MGVDLDWDYSKSTVRLSMKDCINTSIQRFKYARTSKPTHSTHPHQKPAYGATTKHAPEPDNSCPLSPDETTKLQAITGTLLCYARAVDNDHW